MRDRPLRFVVIVSVFLVAAFGAETARAYVFNLSDAGLAPYIRGSAADTLQSSQAYSRTSGSQTSFSDGVDFGFSGEVGVQFNLSDQYSIRLGFEGYEGKSIDASGTNSSGTQLMTVNSLAMVLNPNLGLQYNFENGPDSRIYLLLDGGYAMATVTNNDSLTSSGASQYPGGSGSSVDEKWTGHTISYVAGLGVEYRAFQNSTLGIEAGYRYMQFSQFTYASSGSAVRGSAVESVNQGDIVTDNGGGRVTLNMSGIFVAAVLRFYLPPLGEGGGQ